MARFGSKRDGSTQMQEAMMVLREHIELSLVPDDKTIRLIAPSGEKMMFHADDLWLSKTRTVVLYQRRTHQG